MDMALYFVCFFGLFIIFTIILLFVISLIVRLKSGKPKDFAFSKSGLDSVSGVGSIDGGSSTCGGGDCGGGGCSGGDCGVGGI
jgi:hypothetical protein